MHIVGCKKGRKWKPFHLSINFHRSTRPMKGCDTETHPQVFDLFVLFQLLKEGLEKVGPLHMAWSHTQGVNVSTWKKQGHGAALHTGLTGWHWWRATEVMGCSGGKLRDQHLLQQQVTRSDVKKRGSLTGSGGESHILALGCTELH